MSVLLAALMAFGGLAESQYYTVIKSTGISFGEIVWPAMVVSLLVCGGLLYFNNVLLPEANFRAQQLWTDIRDKRPGFELKPGVFYDGLDDYSILVQERPPGTNRLIDVTIYDYTRGRNRQAILKAERGRIESEEAGARLTLVLRNGEMHRKLPPGRGQPSARYETLQFDRHVIHFSLSDAVFTRSDSEGDRSTRTMPLRSLLRTTDSLAVDLSAEYQDLNDRVNRTLYPDVLAPDTSARSDPSHPLDSPSLSGRPLFALAAADSIDQRQAITRATGEVRSLQSRIQDTRRDAKWKDRRLRSYRVEIHKKFSIAIACIIFMFIGAPLGLALRRGGLATIGAVALGIFMFYWITLVQGEKLSERGFFPPWIGMWIANLLMSGTGLWLILYVVLDLGATPPLRRRLWTWVTSGDE
jgi:lipopolysaccharide export system permease protein